MVRLAAAFGTGAFAQGTDPATMTCADFVGLSGDQQMTAMSALRTTDGGTEGGAATTSAGTGTTGEAGAATTGDTTTSGTTGADAAGATAGDAAKNAAQTQEDRHTGLRHCQSRTSRPDT